MARINLWEGAVRSGKTVSSLMRWVEYVSDAPAGDLLMVGKTLRTLHRNVLRPLGDFLGPRSMQLSLGAGEGTILGRPVYLVGANDERSEGKIRGMTIAGAYGDEVTLWPESFFTMLLSRLSVAGAKFFGTTNPDGPFHWLKRGYLDRAELVDSGSLASWRFTIDDNPHLDPDFVASLKREYTGLWYKRFILGLWVLAEGAVYDQFNQERHALEGPPFPVHHLIAGVDYGTTNPCTFGLYGLPFGWQSDRRAHLLREYRWDSASRGRQLTDAEYADAFVEFLGDDHPARTYVDPSAASFIQELRSRGFAVLPADNDVLSGIRYVSGMLTAGRYTLDRACTHTVEEFGAYVWDPRAAQRGEDAPLKRYDHAMDRDRYALYSHFGKARQPMATAGARTY
jgi:PBSX family phage terminase large subunit